MELGLHGRRALVCASSEGLGLACADALAREGCDVTLNGRDSEKLARAINTINRNYPGKAQGVVADINEENGRRLLLEACPCPDILVNNNAGPAPREFHQLDNEAIVYGLNANMITPIALIRAVINNMVANKFGRIVNITSTSVLAPIAGLDLSSGARAGLTAFLAGLARTVVADNVTINNILPGKFATGRIRQLVKNEAKITAKTEEEIFEQYRSANPAQRLGLPEELGDLCAFICSAQSGYMTGQNFVIDGGAYQSAF